MSPTRGSGRLLYVAGPSGVGKDCLLAGLRAALRAEDGAVVAHRYITRPVQAGGENHVALSEEEFRLRAAAGCFALQWESHGLRYGVGREIEIWLAQGLDVLVNGSRAYLPEARRRFPGLLLVHVTASPRIVAERLAARGRESAAQVLERLQRNAGFADMAEADKVLVNDGEPAAAIAELLAWLRTRRVGHAV